MRYICFLSVAFLVAFSSVAIDAHANPASVEVQLKSWRDLRGKNYPAGTVFEVSGKINMKGARISLPNNSTLSFNGGRFTNGEIHFNNTRIDGEGDFLSVKCSGSIQNDEVHGAWFDKNESSLAWLFSMPGKCVDLDNGVYHISSSVYASRNSSYKNASVVVDSPLSSAICVKGKDRQYGQKLEQANVSFEDFNLDLNNLAAGGFDILFVDGAVIRSCKVLNARSNKLNEVVNGIYVYHSDHVAIESSEIGFISADTDLYPRAITMVTCHDCTITDSFIHNIGDCPEFHGDGIQIAVEDTHSLEDVGNITIKGCRLCDCQYRMLKLQQRGVVVDSCKLYTVDKSIVQDQSAVSIYNSNISLTNCEITCLATIPINLGVSNSALNKVSDVVISGNYVENRSSSSMGTVHTSNSDTQCVIANIVVSNNHFVDMSEKHVNSAVSIRNVANNYIIKDNVFENFMFFIDVRSSYFPKKGVISGFRAEGNTLKNVHETTYDTGKKISRGVFSKNKKVE